MKEMDATEKTLRQVLGLAEGTSPQGPTVQRIADAVETIAKYINYDIDAEAYAAGTRGGVPVEEGDPAYENNAAYYADVAASALNGSVRYNEEQELTNAEQAQARENINAAATDGYYQGMTSGNAEQLVSSVGVTDSVPYNRRTTGGSADVGDRLAERAIVGGSVAWNQLVQTGASIFSANRGTKSYDSDTNTFSVDYTSEGANTGLFSASTFKSKSNHVYLLRASVNLGAATAIYFGVEGDTKSATVTANDFSNIATLSKNATDNKSFTFYGRTGGISSGTVQFRDIQIHDLTALFGTTIADYIYSLETANTGSGVAWLKNHGYFLKPYYPYTPAPSMESVMVGEHRTTGLNQFDPDTGKASLIGGMQYQITGAYTALSIDGVSVTPDSNGKFTPTADGELTVTGGNASTTCVHLVWDNSRNGEYEPYVQRTYALDSSVVLRGIPKLDAYNNLYYDGDTYEPNGTVTRRYGIRTFTGANTEYWNLQSINDAGISNFQYNNGLINGVIGKANALVNNLFTPQSTLISATTTEGLYNNSQNNLFIRIASSKASTVEQFRTWLASNPLTVVYELATPTTETAEPWQEVQIIDDFGTEEYTDAAYENGDRDFALPVGHDSYYQANLRAKLEMAPNSPDDGDGDYIVRQTGGINEYVKLSIATELPANPSTDGSYHLAVTVSGGAATLAWVADN